MNVTFHNTAGSNDNNVMLHRMCSIFFFIFLVGGIICAWLAIVRPLRVYMNAQNWPQVACQIDEARIIETDDYNDEGIRRTYYSAKISFSYEYEGKRHTSDRVHISGFSSSRSTNRQEWVDYIAPFAERRSTVCFVNPANPDEAYLDRSLHLIDFVIGTTMTAVFLGCAFLFRFVKGRLS